ncbi:hypothetical protein E7T06_18265 [Deinococcus sp. Arct2-2]|nr:hypothetical protein E7T06_18265 [Deinococcus sp. Arct2-2]
MKTLVQKLFVRSTAAKMLATRKATQQNQGKHTLGWTAAA